MLDIYTCFPKVLDGYSMYSMLGFVFHSVGIKGVWIYGRLYVCICVHGGA